MVSSSDWLHGYAIILFLIGSQQRAEFSILSRKIRHIAWWSYYYNQFTCLDDFNIVIVFDDFWVIFGGFLKYWKNPEIQDGGCL